MALIAIAADKGAPGVTTAAVALAAVWPRPVLLAECDPAGGDLIYRLPAASGSRLDPRRGLLSLAISARRGGHPGQVWEHAQKLRGGLDVLVGVANAEQGAGLDLMWDQVGAALAALPEADVIADCGRLGADGRAYDLLARADGVILVTRANLGDLVRLRDRAGAIDAAIRGHGGLTGRIGALVIADHKHFGPALAEVTQVLSGAGSPVSVLGGLAHEPRSAEMLSGEWGGKLDRSLLIRTAREVAAQLVGRLAANPEPAAVAYPPASLPPASLPPASLPRGGPAAVSPLPAPAPAAPGFAPVTPAPPRAVPVPAPATYVGPVPPMPMPAPAAPSAPPRMQSPAPAPPPPAPPRMQSPAPAPPPPAPPRTAAPPPSAEWERGTVKHGGRDQGSWPQPRQDHFTGGQVTRDRFTGEPLTGGDQRAPEPRAGDGFASEPLTRDELAPEQLTRDPLTREPSAPEPFSREPFSREPLTREPLTREPFSRGPGPREPDPRGPSPRESGRGRHHAGPGVPAAEPRGS
ncbi:MAG TPA: hypothetical protein VGM79_15020 [Streptosporangiaceae bacterium]